MTTAQPSLFDAQAQKEKDKSLAQQLTDDVALLDQRIVRAEAWLNNPATKSDPRRTKAETEYWKIVGERDRKLCIAENRRELKCVVLQLPPAARYQPKGSDTAFDTLRVLFNGKPAAPNEITLDGLNAYMKTMGWIKETL